VDAIEAVLAEWIANRAMRVAPACVRRAPMPSIMVATIAKVQRLADDITCLAKRQGRQPRDLLR